MSGLISRCMPSVSLFRVRKLLIRIPTILMVGRLFIRTPISPPSRTVPLIQGTDSGVTSPSRMVPQIEGLIEASLPFPDWSLDSRHQSRIWHLLKNWSRIHTSEDYDQGFHLLGLKITRHEPIVNSTILSHDQAMLEPMTLSFIDLISCLLLPYHS